MARNKSEKELREEVALNEYLEFNYNVAFDRKWVFDQLGVTPQWSANDRSYHGPQCV